jgi:DNA (cytosine-5)-methyltransferase 1
LSFNEKAIYYKEIEEKEGVLLKEDSLCKKRWNKRRKGDLDYAFICEREENKRTNFSIKLINKDIVSPTIVSGSDFIKYHKPEHLSDYELMQIGTFPLDYNFLDIKAKYLIGMSVPPTMMAQLANQVYLQWFNNKEVINGE